MGNKKSKDQEDKALSPYSSWGHSLDDLLCGDGKICDDRWTPISLRSGEGSPNLQRRSTSHHTEGRRHSYAFDDLSLEDRPRTTTRGRRRSEVTTRRTSRRNGSVITVQPLPHSAGNLPRREWELYDEAESIRPISADEFVAPVHVPGRHPTYGGAKRKATKKRAKKPVKGGTFRKKKASKKRAKPRAEEWNDPVPSYISAPSVSTQPIQIFIDTARGTVKTNQAPGAVEVVRDGVRGGYIGQRSYNDLRRHRTVPLGQRGRSLDRNAQEARARKEISPAFRSPPPGATDSSSSGSTGRRIVPPKRSGDAAPPAPFRVLHAPDDLLAVRRLPTADVFNLSVSR
ncbi:unnamed protein product, partial [Mesorhabditis spiculigera]